MARAGRRDGSPVKIAVVANDLSSPYGNLEQSWLRRLDSALGFDFRYRTFCVGERSVSFSGASGRTSGSEERSFRDSVGPSHAAGRLEPRRH
jgi:hypothetical protein